MANPIGYRKLLEQLHADGIRYLFGNPGSSEEGLLDEITRFPAIRYIHGLQEAAIVGVADGYAQATQRSAVVQLHSGVGLGNGTSGLYHALRKQTPRPTQRRARDPDPGTGDPSGAGAGADRPLRGAGAGGYQPGHPHG